jgi:TPR repeat protein
MIAKIGELLIIIFFAFFFVRGVVCEDASLHHRYSLRDADQAYTAGDYAKALDIYSKICHFEDSKGKSCFMAGYFYSQGIGVSRDIIKSLYFFEKSCEKGYLYGCLELGWIYGVGIKIRDEKYAKYLFEKLCKEGYEEGCKGLSKLKSYLIRENAEKIGNILLDLIPIKKGIKLIKSGIKIIENSK